MHRRRVSRHYWPHKQWHHNNFFRGVYFHSREQPMVPHTSQWKTSNKHDKISSSKWSQLDSRTNTKIPVSRSPFIKHYTEDETEHLCIICQHAHTTELIRCAWDHRLYMSLHEPQTLISHGQPTSRMIVLLYTKLISDHYSIPYLNTDFISWLKENGWQDVARCFSNLTHNNRMRSLMCPDMPSEPAIYLHSFMTLIG